MVPPTADRVCGALSARVARALLPAAVALLSAPAGDRVAAQERTPPAGDTILRIVPGPGGLPWLLPGTAATDVPFVRLGRARIPVTRLGLRSVLPAGGRPGDPRPPLASTDWTRDRLLRFGVLGRTVGFRAVPEPSDRTGRGREREQAAPARFRNEFVDLGFSVRGTGQFGGDWTEFRPCDEAVETCEVSLVPRITPDIEFAATADGTITDRMVVDVDYDQAREYEGTNRVNVSYRGLPGEVFQRFDIGDVRFDLPQSRFLREGVPTGNFGFQAALEAGPVEVQSVWAQQAGEVTTRTFRLGGSGQGFSRSDTLVLDDADYIEGQFFFLFDPGNFYDHPHIDVLALTPSDARPAVTPGESPIQLYSSEIDLYSQQQVEGYIQADAIAAAAADTVVESAWFRYLEPGRDYMVHPSGLWIALRSPLLRDQMLAVTYVTATGDTVGTYNPEQVYRSGGRPRLRLLRASTAQHQPGRPTWRTEMHQIYRVSSSGEVDPATVELTISLGEESAGRTFARRPNGDDVTYLRLFGLDEESPRDRLDESQLYRPELDSFEDLPPVSGTFIVFPTLEPFASPPPLRNLEIDSTEVRGILGANRNERIYRAPDPFEREYGGVFRLNISFEARGEGVMSSFALGAAGIRERTERVTLDDRPLVRGVHYTIEYDAGVLRLIDPDALLAANPGRDLEVTWEQRSFLQLAPSSVFGLNAHYDLGDYGALNLVGLYQTEDRLVRRPRLGVEASAVGLGGINGELNLDAPLLTRVLKAIPGLRAGEQSSFHVSGEAAVSLPNPNTQGAVYLDDFDGINARPLSVMSFQWRLGSLPAHRDGAEDVLPPELSVSTVAAMTWQHTWIEKDVGGDSLGVFEGFYPDTDIDQQIRITGSPVREPGLYVRFEPESGDTEGPGAWSSITTVLSPTGTDLTKSDFVEFYVRDGDFLSLVLDVGVVSEDAFFVDSTGAVNGLKGVGSVQWGQGILDQEADPRRGEVWGKEADERGVWFESCVAERGRVYSLGDPNANCTRGNGREDSEDLDEDGNLDTQEHYRRFVIRLDGSSPFLVRDRDETGTRFRLYRVPLRGQSGIDVGGTITDADLRAVRHLRLTVAGNRRDHLVLARMSIVGSTWIKRSETGVLTGFGGDTASVHGRVEVGPVSRLTVGDAYTSPPGVIEELDDPTEGFGGQGIEFNERSLSIGFGDIRPGDRVEVYNRFPQYPRDFLSYREARLWVVAPRGDFVPEVPAFFFVKIGTDDRNFYLYRKRLSRTATPGRVGEEDWLPETVIRFDQWLRLRREAEIELIVEPRTGADPPLVLWSADSTYAVVMQDRGRAPNLAAVREMSMGVINGTGAPISGEVWVDELRLSRGIRDAGMVAALDAELRGGAFLQSWASLRSRSGYFRQLRASPTFQDDRSLDAQATLQLGRFAPDSWGLQVPLSVTYGSEDQSPIFLGRSDVQADRLQWLRRPGFDQTRVDLAFWRSGPERQGFWNAVLDGVDVRVGMARSSLKTITTESDGRSVDALVGYGVRPALRDFPLFPGWAGSALRRILPAFLDERIAGARLRWTPERVAFQGEVLDRELSTSRFDRIIRTAGDSLVTPTEAPRRQLTASAEIVLRPLTSFTAEADVLSVRDLLAVAELAEDPGSRDLLRAARKRMAGVDLGWEVDRHLRTRLVYEPRLADWAGTRVEMNTIYLSERNSDLIETRHTPVDSALVLLRNVDGQRKLVARLLLEPSEMVAGPGESGMTGASWLRALDSVSFHYENGLISRFNREPVAPGVVYELGWGGRDDFLVIGRDSASTLSDREVVRVGGGLLLPGSSSLALGYEHRRHQTLDTRSDRRDRREVWPNVVASVTDMAPPGFLAAVVERFSLSAGYRRGTRTTQFGVGARQNRFREDRAVPVFLALVVPGGVSLRYRGSRDNIEIRDPTGNTSSEKDNHTISASGTFRSPLAAFRQRGAPMRVELRLSYSDEVRCRIQSGTSACVAFIDQLDRNASVSVESTVREYEVGARLNYLDQRSFVGQRAGQTRWQLEIYGHFLLTPDVLGS